MKRLRPILFALILGTASACGGTDASPTVDDGSAEEPIDPAPSEPGTGTPARGSGGLPSPGTAEMSEDTTAGTEGDEEPVGQDRFGRDKDSEEEPADGDPEEPEPQDPEPQDPEPQDPEPQDPEPQDPEPANCVSTDLEPNDVAADAISIGTDGNPEPLQEICGADDVDVFEFSASAGEKITSLISFTHADGDLDLELYAPSAASGVDNPDEPTRAAISVTDDEQIEFVTNESGTHYLVVYSYNTANTYTLTNTVKTTAGCTDADMFAGNHSQSTSQELLFQTHTGLQLCGGQDDWYDFLLFAGDSVEITLKVTEGNPEDVEMQLYQSGSLYSSASANGDTIELSVTAQSQRSYDLQVMSTSEITYELTLAFTI